MNILCIPYTYILSHISRPLLIAKELKARGNEVIFAGESPKTRFIRQAGFTVVPLYEPDPNLLLGNIRAGKLSFATNAEIQRMIEADVTLYRKVNPDLVLTDFRFTASLSAHIAELRHAAIVNASSTTYRSLPYIPLFEWIPKWLIRRNSGLWGSFDSLNLKLEMLIFDDVMSIFKKLSKKYGVKKTVTASNCLTGKDITLLPDIPQYFPTRNLPNNYHYIGPLTWKSDMPAPPWWPPPKSSDPLLYITMGTTGLLDFFHRVYELLEASEMNALITTGDQVQDLQSIDGKIYIEPYIDGDIAAEKCDLVICHGGNGTIYQALLHGKPIIGIPTVPDQQFNMRRVEALGVGRMLSWKDFSNNPSTLLDLARSILSDESFYRNASGLKKTLSRYDAPKMAADILTKGTL
jgi:UDP:flavonoid glycosyltransferase YjiC (YdhE family)